MKIEDIRLLPLTGATQDGGGDQGFEESLLTIPDQPGGVRWNPAGIRKHPRRELTPSEL